MARIVVAGAGAVGASVAHHLAQRGARDVVLADRGAVASGATGKAMGGVRQQFSTAAEVELARASLGLFRELGAPLFEEVGYLFVATTKAGEQALTERSELQRSLGVPVERVSPERVEGLHVDDLHGAAACWQDGIADPVGVTRAIAERAVALGVELREETDALAIASDVLVIACGAASPAVAARRGIELPIRPLCRQLVDVGPVPEVPADLPMVIELETGFHFRRVGRDGLRLAMAEEVPRWGAEEWVDEHLVADWRERLARRFPRAANAPVVRSWAGLYDMTPDAHPIIGAVGDGVYVAAGFSGHGFMQAPAAGDALAAEILGQEPPLDLSAYRLERFAGDAAFPETLVL